MYWVASLLLYFTVLTIYLESVESSTCDTCCSLDFVDCGKKCCDKKTEKVIVCYFTNWAWYRSGRAKFMPDNINASLCTHIIYAFASLDENLTMVSSDSWADIDNKFYELVTAFKEQGLKILLGIGGWNNSGGNKWSRLLSNTTARANFVNSTYEYLTTYNFDGLDLDYEYPGCPQGNVSGGLADDANNFNQMVKELKVVFHEKGYLVTVSAAGGKDILLDCYNMTELCHEADWINMMCYDYNSATSSNVTAANAPICGTGSSFGVYETVDFYVNDLKCPPHKLVMGLPMYAQTYTMESSSSTSFGTPISGSGEAAVYTQTNGFGAYYELCLAIKNGTFTQGWDEKNGSYAYNGNQFFSYDSIIDIIRKCCLINRYYNLRGAMIWTLDYDDFNDMCGCGSYPLLKTINKELRCYNSSCSGCY